MKSTLNSSLFTQITPAEQETLSGGKKVGLVFIGKNKQVAVAKAYASGGKFSINTATAQASNNVSADD